MKLRMTNYIFLAGIVFMSGCAQNVRIKALNPAEVGEMAAKKKVAISGFRSDDVGLSAKIETMIAKHKLDNKKYFTVLSRKDMDKVMAEQKLQSSQLMDEKTAIRVGKLVGAQALVNGTVIASGTEDSYQEDREKCLKYVKDQGCVKYKHYRVTCNTTQAGLSASLNIVDVENGTILYADTLTKNYSADSCRSGQIYTKAQALQAMSNQVADEFVYKLTPHYVSFEVELLDSIEFSVTDEQEATFENALEFLKMGRTDKAEQLMSKVHDELNGQSYVVAYDLGLIKESLGELDDAKKLYALCDELAQTPVPEINAAVIRIDELIAKRDTALAQMER